MKNYLLTRFIPAAVLLLLPWSVQAAEKFDWQTPLIVMSIISSIASFFLMKRTKMAQSVSIKMIIWGAYFWILMFAQGIVAGLWFHFTR